MNYYNLFGPYSNTPYIFKASKFIFDENVNFKSLSILSNFQIAKLKRNSIVDTFKAINCIKENKKWTDLEKIGFMEEMIRCKFNNQIPACGVNEYKKQISERYNVSINKLGSTMVIFITHIKKGLNPSLLDYFSWNELFLYTYTKIEESDMGNHIIYKKDRLLDDFNKNKLTIQELEIYRELYNT